MTTNPSSVSCAAIVGGEFFDVHTSDLPQKCGPDLLPPIRHDL
jgi:hypothetical protein